MVSSNGIPSDGTEGAVAMAWTGLDVSKGYFDASLLPPGTDAAAVEVMSLAVERFERTAEGVAKFVAWVREQLAGRIGAWRLGAVMESSGPYSAPLAAWILDAVADARVTIENPQLTHGFIKSLGLRNKTDQLEARALALYGAQRKTREFAPLTGVYAELHDLVRYRLILIKQQIAMANREEVTLKGFAAESHARLLQAIAGEIEAVDQKIIEVTDSDPQLSKDVALLKTVTGVGPVIATVVLAEMGDLRRFKDRHAAAAFAGLNPRVHESGETVRRKTRQDKRGSGRVRQVLYMGAMAIVRSHKMTPLKGWYLKLIAKGKPDMVALGALMRKLLLVMRAVLIAGHVNADMAKECGKR